MRRFAVTLLCVTMVLLLPFAAGAAAPESAPVSILSVGADRSSALVGETVIWTLRASGGDGTAAYAFNLFRDEKLLVKGVYGRESVFRFAPETEGIYFVIGHAKDSMSSAWARSAGVTVTRPSSAKADRLTPQEEWSLFCRVDSLLKGDTDARFSPLAEGGAGAQVALLQMGLRGLGYFRGEIDSVYSDATLLAMVAYEGANGLQIDGLASEEDQELLFSGRAVAVSVLSAAPAQAPLTIVNVSADRSSAKTGEEIAWTLRADGAAGGALYAFTLYRGGKMIHTSGYGSSAAFVYTPAESGEYRAVAYAKDATRYARAESQAVRVERAVLAISGIAADKTEASAGETITWTIRASGGEGVREYAFIVYNGRNKLHETGYGPDDTCAFVPAEAGSYRVTGFARDVSGTIKASSENILVLGPAKPTPTLPPAFGNAIAATPLPTQAGSALTKAPTPVAPLSSVFILAPTPSASSPKLTLIGHASIKIRTVSGTVVYIDPYHSGDYSEKADLILVSHEHSDHNKVNLCKQNPGCVTLRVKQTINSNGSYNTFEHFGVKIEPFPAYNSNHKKSATNGYLLSFDGILVYFAADTSKIAEMADLASRHVDYAFFPIDGQYNMNATVAMECAALVGARHNTPIHWLNANPAAFAPANLLFIPYGGTVDLKKE